MTRSARCEPAAEIVRLHVDGGNPLELVERRRRDRLDVDVEHVRHPQVLGPRHSLDGADDGRRLRPPQQVAQRQPAGERIGIRIVVQQDEDLVGVGEVALVLLHARSRHRSAELGHERRPDQLGELEIGQVREFRLQLVRRFLVLRPGVQHVGQRPARIANRGQDLANAAAAVVLNDEAGARRDVGFEVGVDPARVTGGGVDAGFVQAPGDRPALDEKIDLEAGQQDVVERPYDQFVLTYCVDAHVRRALSVLPLAMAASS